MTLRRFNLYLNLSFVFPCIGFLLFLCIPLVDTAGSQVQKVGAYLLAASFWVCTVLEVFFTFRCKRERLHLEKKHYRSRWMRYMYPGVISFFKNFEATVADIVLFVAAILTVIFIWIRLSSALISIGCMAILFLSFNMHCLLNGKNYRYKKAFYKHQKEHESNE